MILTERQISVIDSWMHKGMESPKSRPIADLHLDAIDPAWKAKETWLPSGAAAFRFAVSRRSARQLPVSVALVFSLRSATDPLGVTFGDARALQDELDWSPPALYLIRTEEFSAFYRVAKTVSQAFLGPIFSPRECRLMEFQPEGSIEFSRSLHVIG